MSSKRVQRAFKFRFYPTPEQESLLRRTLGCTRLVYNKALELRSQAWTSEQRNVTYKDTSKALTAWKRDESLGFLGEVSCVPLQQALRNLQTAYSRFFNHAGGFPVFKRKAHGGSATFTRYAFTWDGRYALKLAKMSEPLPVKWSRTLPRKAVPSSVTVSLDAAQRWHVSILIEDEIEQLKPVNATVGIDLGVKDFAILSTGEKIGNPRFRERNARRLRYAQRSLERKQKGSNNQYKARIRLARIHAHVTDSRRDFLHKLSTRLIRENQTICVEDLSVQAMSSRCKPIPDMEHPGRWASNGQAAKRGLNRSITDTGWREFRSMLEYKADWYGRQLVVIDHWYPSSQTCSHCGRNTGRKPLNIRSWQCPYCGTKHDRDINAARNVQTAGLAVLACGDARRKPAAVK
jgi:putative transposase